jgi:DNA-binding NarL/FixJ family response regulator
MDKKIRIIVADDKPLMRRTLMAFLNGFPEFEITGEAANGREVLDLLKQQETDLLLLDLEMPVMHGFEVLKVIQQRYKEVRTVVLSVHNDLPCIRECLALGAGGYLSKDCIPEQLIQTLRQVYQKGFYIEETVYKDLLQNYAYEVSGPNRQKLSKREQEILKELYNGKTEKEIASSLNISRGTVHFHRMNIYSKTDTHNLAELLRYINRHHLI